MEIEKSFETETTRIEYCTAYGGVVVRKVDLKTGAMSILLTTSDLTKFNLIDEFYDKLRLTLYENGVSIKDL